VFASVATGYVLLAVVGALLLVATLADVMLTIFNYDGFTFVARRFHRFFWTLLHKAVKVIPSAPLRHSALSLGSSAMLPATVALWLGLEVTAFALMYEPGLHAGHFALKSAQPTIGTAFYLSGGDISSLTFGDVTARDGLDRALADLETVLGLATFTLALGYVVTTFDVLGSLEELHGRVRRHADNPDQPSSILARHFRGGSPSDLPSFLQALGEDLEEYDGGLRRYPVVYYFHTRRTHRSIPHVFAALGDLLALLRWGLPASEPMTQDPFLHALITGYTTTLERLRQNFVGPKPIELPEPVPRSEFRSGRVESVAAFRRLEDRARTCAGVEQDDDESLVYERYAEWLPFAARQRIVLDRVAKRLGYEPPSETAAR
jgi:hypothetical protein